MTRHVRLLTPLAALVLASASSAAQQREPEPDPAPDTQVPPAMVRMDAQRMQAAREALAQSRFNDFARTGALSALQAEDRPEAMPGAPRAMPIDWVAAREDGRAQAAQPGEITTAAVRQVPQFPRPANEQAAEVTNTRLPVLIPASAALGFDSEPAVLLFPRENFYNLSITGDDILIEVFGTRLAHAQAPNAQAARNLRAGDGDGYRFSQTEYGREVSFNRYGAAYSITVECDAPETDPRCASDDYARQLVQSLMIAAGSPDAGGQ
jgi:hypothetical protein